MDISKIYQEFNQDVYRYAMFKLGRKDQAEDIMSETFARLIQSKKVDESYNIKAWLITVARNLIYSKYKEETPSTQDENGLEPVVADESSNLPEDAAIDSVLLDQLKSELANLDENTREVIVLKIWEDLKFSEIAEILKTNENTIKLRYYRGLEKLKTRIESRGGSKLYSVSLPLLILGIGKIGFSPELQIGAAASTIAASIGIGQAAAGIAIGQTAAVASGVGIGAKVAIGVAATSIVAVGTAAVITNPILPPVVSEPVISSPISAPIVSQPTLPVTISGTPGVDKTIYKLDESSRTPLLFDGNGQVADFDISEGFIAYTIEKDFDDQQIANKYSAELYEYSYATGQSTLILSPNLAKPSSLGLAEPGVGYYIKASIELLGYSRDLKYIAYWYNDSIYLYNRAEKTTAVLFENLPEGMYDLDWSANSNYLLLTSDTSGSGDYQTQKLFELINGKYSEVDTKAIGQLMITYGDYPNDLLVNTIHFAGDTVVNYKRYGIDGKGQIRESLGVFEKGKYSEILARNNGYKSILTVNNMPGHWLILADSLTELVKVEDSKISTIASYKSKSPSFVEVVDAVSLVSNAVIGYIGSGQAVAQIWYPLTGQLIDLTKIEGKSSFLAYIDRLDSILLGIGNRYALFKLSNQEITYLD